MRTRHKWPEASASKHGFSSHTECGERCTWAEILTQGQGSHQSGGLGGISTSGEWISWACWPSHPCVAAVGADGDDKMCYAFRELDQTWHTWGLDSELRLCSR